MIQTTHPTSRLPSTGADPRGTAHKALIVTAIAAAAFATQQASAQIATDDFNSYSVGSIDGQSGGSGWAGAWTSDPNQTQHTQVVGTSITYDLEGTTLGGGNSLQLSNNGSILGRDVFSSVQTGGQDYYLSFIFQSNSGGDASTNASNFTAWRADDTTGDYSTGDYAVSRGVINSSTAQARVGATTASTDSGLIQQATTYFMVIGFLDYDGGSGTYTTTKTWLNPGTGDENTTDSTIVATATGTGGSAGFQGIAARGNSLSVTEVILFDDFKVGTTFDSVVPVSVPEPSAYALLFGAATLGFVACGKRRRS